MTRRWTPEDGWHNAPNPASPTTGRTEQARAEAERRWPGQMAVAPVMKARFLDGVEWADANPQPRTITREAAMEVWLSGEDFGDFADALKAAGVEVEA